MKKLLVSGIVLTGMVISWSCGKTEPPAQTKTTETAKTETPTPAAEAPKAIEAPKVETPVSPTDTTKTAEAVKTPVLPHTITDAEVGLKAKCPVMGTEITVTKETLSAEYKGKVYYFCCSGCPEEFKKNPDKYAATEEKK